MKCILQILILSEHINNSIASFFIPLWMVAILGIDVPRITQCTYYSLFMILIYVIERAVIRIQQNTQLQIQFPFMYYSKYLIGGTTNIAKIVMGCFFIFYNDCNYTKNLLRTFAGYASIVQGAFTIILFIIVTIIINTRKNSISEYVECKKLMSKSQNTEYTLMN